MSILVFSVPALITDVLFCTRMNLSLSVGTGTSLVSTTPVRRVWVTCFISYEPAIYQEKSELAPTSPASDVRVELGASKRRQDDQPDILTSTILLFPVGPSGMESQTVSAMSKNSPHRPIC
ncbi:hypothetical protein D9M68_430410 [compost metagenome]